MKRNFVFMLIIWMLTACAPNMISNMFPNLYDPTDTPQPTATISPTATPLGGGKGKVIFLRDDKDEEDYDIYTMDTDGTNVEQLTFMPGIVHDAIWSPDGEKILYSYKLSESDLSQFYIMSPDGSDVAKVSKNSKASYINPDWSPDGDKIVFNMKPDDESSQWNIYVMNADGSEETLLTDEEYISMDPDWSPDGTKIVYVSNDGQVPEIFTMNADGSERTQITFFSSGQTGEPKWSPDGEHIVYYSESGEDGQLEREIYIMRADGTDIRRLTDNDTWDLRPKFSPDGTKISWDSCCFKMSVMNLDGTQVETVCTEFGWDFEWQP